MTKIDRRILVHIIPDVLYNLSLIYEKSQRVLELIEKLSFRLFVRLAPLRQNRREMTYERL